MIRILHVINSINMGGIQTTLINILKKIDKEKVVFDFLVETNPNGDYAEEIKKFGGKIYYITPRKKSILQNRKDLDKFFKQHQEYKIVHMHVSSLTYITPLKYAKKYNIPIRIIHSRNTKQGGMKIHKFIHLFNKIFIDRIATHYFACSDLAGEWLFPKKLINSSNFKIINNGIDTDKFAFDSKLRNDMRKKLNCENDICLVCVGRLHQQKNHMFLLEVFKKLSLRLSNTKLYLVGEGSLRKKIEDKIDELDLKNRVVLLGNQKNINEILQAMDMFIMPSFYEGLPGSVIEAQGSGLPCVISDTITKLVKVTDLVTFVSLEEQSDKWVSIILKKIKNAKRENTKELLVKKGFDMANISKELQNFYLEVGDSK